MGMPADTSVVLYMVNGEVMETGMVYDTEIVRRRARNIARQFPGNKVRAFQRVFSAESSQGVRECRT